MFDTKLYKKKYKAKQKLMDMRGMEIEILADERNWCIRKRSKWYKYKVISPGTTENFRTSDICYADAKVIDKQFVRIE